MPNTYSRRQFLHSAGGLTLLALIPIGKGLFAADKKLMPMTLPIFTALPYIQPGPEGRLISGAEVTRLAWQTEGIPANFEVNFSQDYSFFRSAEIHCTSRDYTGPADKGSRLNYVSSFTSLELGTKYYYRVRCNNNIIIEGYFTTRQPRGLKIRFVAFGDNSFGDPSERAIAYQAYRVNPDFVMNTGDNVYDSGLDTEYSRYFFPVYNADVANSTIGAPLLRSIPFYTVLANHDVYGKHPAKNNIACANFEQNADSLAYYTNFYFPLNGLQDPKYPTLVYGPIKQIEDFKACCGSRFPTMANYSFDVGDAHFLCLDSNNYTDATDDSLQLWINADLIGSDARWKFVIYHHGAFNVGLEHRYEQHMRVLSPIFEAHGVNIVLSGHEHNYQRTVPLHFSPKDTSKAHNLHSENRIISGDFQLDLNFDGLNHTKANGIIYITTGAGGKYLYDTEFNNDPSKLLIHEDHNIEYTIKMVSDRHSLTVFDLDSNELIMRQIDEQGNEIDRIRLT